jgi:hypothetical protein
MGNNMLENLKAFLETDEGKESIKRFAEKLEQEAAHNERWVEKFKARCEDDLDGAIEKLMEKYYSDAYTDREYYKRQCEPREPLLWLAVAYAEKYCKPCEDEKYFNMFTGAAWYIGSYVIQVMHGQGSVIRIDKIEKDEQ